MVNFKPGDTRETIFLLVGKQNTFSAQRRLNISFPNTGCGFALER